MCVWGGGGGGGGGVHWLLCSYGVITNMREPRLLALWRACTHLAIEQTCKYLVSHLGFLLVASPEPALVEILHMVGYRKFMFVKVTVLGKVFKK